MTSFKEYINIQNSLKRLSYKSFLDVSKDNVWIQLELSLLFDGRFYGAEMMEYDTLDDMAGMFSHLVEHPFDTVKAVREVRDADFSEYD